MKVNKMKFYSDAGHGWYAVKRSLIEKLGIATKISHFSYQKGSTVYVEEDGDALTLMTALEAAKEPYTVVEVDHGNRSQIRNYQHYKTGEV